MKYKVISINSSYDWARKYGVTEGCTLTEVEPGKFISPNQETGEYVYLSLGSSHWIVAKPVTEPTFKAGDKVRIIKCKYTPSHGGCTGVIADNDFKQINLDSKFAYKEGRGAYCNSNNYGEIELITDDHEEHLKLHDEATKQKNPKEEGGERNMAFTIGDEVKAIGSCGTGSSEGDLGVIESYYGGLRVAYHGGSSHCERHMDNWELISSAKETMASINKLTKTQKESWTKDQQALYQVGLVNASGEVTDTIEAISALVRVNHKALVAQAEADIAEAEAEEKAAKAVK